jgi:hypothetical protein
VCAIPFIAGKYFAIIVRSMSGRKNGPPTIVVMK